MSRHNIRPRVLDAAYRLRTFTVQELSDAAQVDRKSVYSQLGDLEDSGYLTSEPLSIVAAHRPPKLYRLSQDPSKLRSLAEEIGLYRSLQPSPDTRAVASAVSNTQDRLLRIEDELNAIDPASKDAATIERSLRTIASVGPRLEDARIELETAVLETPPDVTLGRSPQHSVMIELARWREAASRRDALEKQLKERHAELTQAALVRASVQGAAWRKRIPVLRRSLLELIGSRPAVEVFMDSLEAERGIPLLVRAHLVERALKANDMEVVRLCFQTREPTGSPWWRYNQRTLEFLSTGFREQAWEAWLNEIKSWKPAGKRALKRTGKLGLYLYRLNSLTQQRYVTLAEANRVSVITPAPLDFLFTAQETIGPTLVDVASAISTGSQRRLGTTDVRQLEFPFAAERNAVWQLYGYGPVVSRIREWPGAPAIRVAGSLHTLGVSLIMIERAMIALSREQKGLVLVESDRVSSADDLNKHVRSILESVEELAVF